MPGSTASLLVCSEVRLFTSPSLVSTARAVVSEEWLEESAMQIEERVVESVTILDLKGKMTLGEGDELLKDKINSLIQQDKKKLLLNLEGVPYIDSAGLGEIVRTYTTVSRQGGKLKLLNLTKRIQDLLAITKLLTVFETYDSEERSHQELQQLVGAQPAALRMARHTIPESIARSASSPAAARPVASSLLASLRPSQWTKNLIIFAALMFGQRLLDPHALLYSVGSLRDFLRVVGRRLPDQRRRRPRSRSPASGQDVPADRVRRAAGPGGDRRGPGAGDARCWSAAFLLRPAVRRCSPPATSPCSPSTPVR